MILYITGGIGAGKSTFMSSLKETLKHSEVSFMDLDVEAKKLVASLGFTIPEDRTEVFRNPELLHAIEDKVIPGLRALVKYNKGCLIVEASTFFEMPVLRGCDDLEFTVMLTGGSAVAERVLARDKLDRHDLVAGHQLPVELKACLADFVIENTGTLSDLHVKAVNLAHWVEFVLSGNYYQNKAYLEMVWDTYLPELGTDLFEDVINKYSHPSRHYHDISHLVFLFEGLDTFLVETKIKLSPLWLKALVLALFYHDVVMDFRPGADNEARSAQYLWGKLRGLDDIFESCGARSVVTYACGLILLTKNHAVPESTCVYSSGEGRVVAELFLDLDLSILAVDASAFVAYDAQIRREWQGVCSLDFAKGRLGYLEGFLEQAEAGTLFKSEFLGVGLNEMCQGNLKKAIEVWTGVLEG